MFIIALYKTYFTKSAGGEGRWDKFWTMTNRKIRTKINRKVNPPLFSFGDERVGGAHAQRVHQLRAHITQPDQLHVRQIYIHPRDEAAHYAADISAAATTTAVATAAAAKKVAAAIALAAGGSAIAAAAARAAVAAAIAVASGAALRWAVRSDGVARRRRVVGGGGEGVAATKAAAAAAPRPGYRGRQVGGIRLGRRRMAGHRLPRNLSR